jgi:hypothetical protein
MMKKQRSIRRTAHAGYFREDGGEVLLSQGLTQLGKHKENLVITRISQLDKITLQCQQPMVKRTFINWHSDLCKSSGIRGKQTNKNMPKILATTE